MDLITANRLQQLRKMNGYSQDVLAEKLGVSRQAVSKWERAESSPDTDNLISLAKLYGLTLDDLLNTSQDVIKIKAKPQEKDFKGKVKSILSKANDFGIYPKVALGMLKFPFVILIPILYLAISFPTKLWHPLWIIFLTIPVYYRTAIACKANSFKVFLLLMPIPEITVIVFLLLGLLAGAWSYAWIVFLIIPIYYWVVPMMKSEKKEEEQQQQQDK